MSLLDNFLKYKCVLMEKKRTPDGAGGWITEWAEGAEFDANIVIDQSLQARVAEKEGVTSVYTVTTRRSTVLEFHDVFKRLSDGTARMNGAPRMSQMYPPSTSTVHPSRPRASPISMPLALGMVSDSVLYQMFAVRFTGSSSKAATAKD